MPGENFQYPVLVPNIIRQKKKSSVGTYTLSTSFQQLMLPNINLHPNNDLWLLSWTTLINIPQTNLQWILKWLSLQEAKAVAGHTFFPHENPPLKAVVSDIKELPFHTAKMAYNGEYIFMGVYPEPGDVIEFWFQNPTELKRYVIIVWPLKHP